MTGITFFIVDKMSAYVVGGSTPETAANFTRGELEAIYKGNHHSRDTSGAWRITPKPEVLPIDTAMKKCDDAISEFINQKYQVAKLPLEKPSSTYRGSEAIKHTVTAGVGIKYFFTNSKDNDPAAYTTDLKKIGAMWNEGQRRFKAFINGRFLAIDLDRKPGKIDGLEMFYRLFPREILPAELQYLPQSFPCYVQTPTGGFHLYFRYTGPEFKMRELGQGIEIKEWQITCPGSRRENGEYVLHGELNDAPPLYGLIIDAIVEAKQKKEREKAEHSKTLNKKATANHSMQITQSQITLEDLAHEAVEKYAGHHDRQVSFAGKACRCKYSGADALAYVKSRPDIFGKDTDTENTILSVYRDNRAA